MRSILENFSYPVIAAAVSILAHFLLIAFSGWIPVRALPPSLDLTTRSIGRRLTITTVDWPGTEDAAYRTAAVRDETDSQALLDLVGAIRPSTSVQRLFDERGLLDAQEPQLQLSDQASPAPAADTGESTQRLRPMTGPRPEILAFQHEFSPLPPLSSSQPVTPRVPRSATDEPRLPSLFHDSATVRPSVLRTELLLPATATMPELAEAIEFSRDTPESDPERIVDQVVADPLPTPPPAPRLRRTEEIEEDVAIGELDSMLQVSTSVFRQADGSGYFRIDISPNPASERLRAVDKDVLFLIDTSGSIPERKLRAFRAAVDNALEYLNPRDRFNVVAFRTQPEKLFADYRPVTPGNQGRARLFLRNLMSRGMTDIHRGLAPFIDRELGDHQRPLTIFILTDGVSTVRDRLTNQQIIRHVGREAHDNVSIFTVSAGHRVNRSLLDLLALSNRGKPLHDEDLTDFTDILKDFIASHSEIIVSNLQYRVVAGGAKDIYPRRLPHMARNQMLSLYGRFPAGSEQLAIQIMGRDAAGERQELIYQTRIAEHRDVGPGLRQDWLVQQALHLFVENILHPSPELEARLEQISRTHRIEFPEL